MNGKVPQHTPFLFLLVTEIIWKCGNEQSTKALQDSVIHACVGVEVIPQGSP